MKSWVLAGLLALCPVQALAAITFDSAGTPGNGSTSTSHSHTIAADANIVIVCLAIRDVAGSVQPASAVTVDGAAATFLSGHTNTANVIRVELWYKLAPSTGTVTVAATAHASTDVLITGSMSFKGVAQSSTFNTAKSVGSDGVDSANEDVDTLASAVGEMGVMCGAARSATTATFDGTAPTSTERYDDTHDVGGNTLGGHGYTEDGASTSINMRVDLSASVQWAATAVSMRAAAASTRRPIAPLLFQ